MVHKVQNQVPMMGHKIMEEAVPGFWRHRWPFVYLQKRFDFHSFFPCSHLSRCEAGPGGKRVALSLPGRWALKSCASASPEEKPTSHSKWEKQTYHLSYIKSVRLNREANNLQHSRCCFRQIWPLVTLIMFVQSVHKLSKTTEQMPFAKKYT